MSSYFSNNIGNQYGSALYLLESCEITDSKFYDNIGDYSIYSSSSKQLKLINTQFEGDDIPYIYNHDGYLYIYCYYMDVTTELDLQMLNGETNVAQDCYQCQSGYYGGQTTSLGKEICEEYCPNIDFTGVSCYKCPYSNQCKGKMECSDGYDDELCLQVIFIFIFIFCLYNY